MDVLYLHPAGAYGGASKSLIELYQVLKKYGVRGTVLTPRGSASVAFADAGMVTEVVPGLSQFDNTRFGHYRGLRWLILLREFTFFPLSLLAIWRLKGRHFDVLHANEATLLPLAILAKKLLRMPMVVHIRSLQCEPASNWRTRLFTHWLVKYADAVIPIDHSVARTLDPSLHLNIVHNGFHMADSRDVRKKPRAVGQPVRVGFMGVLVELKGIYELIEAIRILRDRGVAIECVIAGENARNLSGARAWVLSALGFARNVSSDLEKLIHRYGLERQVQLLGFMKDVGAVYRTLDILCFPSYLNAAGRPVFEAAFFEVPSVVAVKDPLPDAVIHGKTGLAISQPIPELIADALQSLAENEEFRVALGRRAKTWAKELFDIENSASIIMRIYRQFHGERESR